MTIATTTDTTPHVWVGCLACCNDGRLVGDWHDASEADDVTTTDVHGRASSHDELWCFDTENIPVRREMSPNEAAEWGRVFDELEEHQRDALYAWVASGVTTSPRAPATCRAPQTSRSGTPATGTASRTTPASSPTTSAC